MGENEQGGMLRVVVVLGLIALIAAVVIGGVVYAKNNMQDKVVGTASLIDKAKDDASATQPVSEDDVPKDAWQSAGDDTYPIRYGQHVAVRYDDDVTDLVNGYFQLKDGLIIENEDVSKVDAFKMHANVDTGFGVLTDSDFEMFYQKQVGNVTLSSLDDLINYDLRTQADVDGTGNDYLIPVPSGADINTLTWQEWLKWYSAHPEKQTSIGNYLSTSIKGIDMFFGWRISKDVITDGLLPDNPPTSHVFLSTTITPDNRSLEYFNDLKTIFETSDLTVNEISDYTDTHYRFINYWSAMPGVQIAIW